MPGAKDEMAVWDEFWKQRLQKYYLTLYIREAYAIFKKTWQEDEAMCSMSTFTKLRPMNVHLLSDTPEDTYKCQTHENRFLKLKAMGHSYDNFFWGEVLCDTSQNVMSVGK